MKSDDGGMGKDILRLLGLSEFEEEERSTSEVGLSLLAEEELLKERGMGGISFQESSKAFKDKEVESFFCRIFSFSSGRSCFS